MIEIKKTLQIGNLTIPGILSLGPMAGVTDLPFRLLCKEQGASLLCTEMVSAKGILYNNKNTEPLITIDEKERPIALQLFGSDPKIMSEMAKRIEERNFDILDINMGCPVPKVVNNGEGSALMKDSKRVGEIVKAISTAIQKPVTVKIRKGFGEDDRNAVEIAKVIEANGGAAIAVHGRTREQFYHGKADWSIIKEVKEAVSIPVIGNGDINSPEDGKRMLEETGCDGIMIARGAQGNPWIFHQIKEYLEQGVILPKPDIDEVIAMMLRHANLLVEFKGPYIGIREMRKHVAWYTSSYPHSSKLRNMANLVEDMESLKELLARYRENLEKTNYN